MKNDAVSLWLVGTPIGNLGDISSRALEILGAVDFVAAEDTRTSGVLLSHYNIKKPMVSYHEHNAAESGKKIIARLRDGETCALVSDAGMPAISDPGERLARECREAGLTVSAVPGPCAAVTALALSGFPTRRFCFEGFPETTPSRKRERFEALKDDERTTVFYEAPHRLAKTLALMAEVFGADRPVALVREMTKVYEECRVTTLGEAAAYYSENEPRGEFVLVVGGKPEAEKETLGEDELKRAFDALLEEGMTRSAAAKELARRTGLNKRDLYDRFKEE